MTVSSVTSRADLLQCFRGASVEPYRCVHDRLRHVLHSGFEFLPLLPTRDGGVSPEYEDEAALLQAKAHRQVVRNIAAFSVADDHVLLWGHP